MTGGEPALPTPSRYWLKLDALLHRNPKVGRLTDSQFRAYITSLAEGKLARSEGEWPTRDHYTYAVGSKVARHLDALIAAGLLEEVDGWIRVHDWNDWQPNDPTAAERSKRYRDKHRRERDATRDDTDRHTEEKREDSQKGLDHLGVTRANGSGATPMPPCPRCGKPFEYGETPLAVREHGRTREIHQSCAGSPVAA